MKSLLRRNRITTSVSSTGKSINSRAITHKVSDLGEVSKKGGKRRFEDVSLFEAKVSLIAKQWHMVMPIVIIAYIVIQCLISTQSSPYCIAASPYSSHTYKVAIAFVSCYAMGFSSFLFSAVFVHTFTECESSHLRGVYVGAATVLLLAGCATGLYLTHEGNYACHDAFGIYSPTAQWAEWLIASPLLSYLTISIEEKPTHLTTTDLLAIFSMFMCILFGFMMCFTADRTTGTVLYILSAVCMLSTVVIARYNNGKHQYLEHKVVDKAEQTQPLWGQGNNNLIHSLVNFPRSFFCQNNIPSPHFFFDD